MTHKIPETIELIAPAKVNLYLDIGAVRSDGYHEVVTVMHALLWHDVLRMRALSRTPGAGLDIKLSCQTLEGLDPLDIQPEDNIVFKAVSMLAEIAHISCDQTIEISIEKHIPAQAGLGGGSSDAACALVGAARLWGLPADGAYVKQAARSLGADVVFFLHGGCVCLTGVGDVVDHRLSPMDDFVVIVKPKGGVSTVLAYKTFDENPARISEANRKRALSAQRAQDVPLCNNLVAASQKLLPALAEVQTWAQNHRDIKAFLMSGSGSAVFAICSHPEGAQRVAASAQSHGWWARPTRFASLGATIASL